MNTFFSVLLLPALLSPQQTAQDTQALYFDGVAVQAGDNVITLSRVNRFEAKSLQQRPVTTPAERAQLRSEILRELSWQALETQAAEELGLDPAAIRFNLEIQAQEERAKIGAAAYALQLTEQGTNAHENFADREAEYLRVLWRRSQLGLQVADLRPSTDRYIRPGELHYSFRANKDLIAPPQVRFQILAVPSAAAGSSELALGTCEEARRKVLEGGDFSSLVEDYGAALRETQGVTRLLSTPEIGDPMLRKLAEGQEGDLSEVTPLRNPRGELDPSQGYQLVMLLKKIVPPPPRYEDAEVQTYLRAAQTQQRDTRLMNLAKRDMLRDSYSWIHPGLAQAPQPAQAPGPGSAAGSKPPEAKASGQ